MKMEKIVDTCSNLLSDVATEITQSCSDRSNVMEIYLGSGLPQLQLALFKPILLENYAFFCFLLKNDELRRQLQIDSEDLVDSLELDSKTFFQTRFEEYAASDESINLYLEYCAFAITSRRNAPNRKIVQMEDSGSLENRTLLTLQLSARKLQETAESM